MPEVSKYPAAMSWATLWAKRSMLALSTSSPDHGASNYISSNPSIIQA